MNLSDVMIRGGAVMWPILLCSLLALYVILERWMVLRGARFDAAQFLLKLKSLYRHGDVPAVIAYCAQKDIPIANIIRHSLADHGRDVAIVRESVENATRNEVFRLERRLPVLASISSVAPLLGFLGTVIGLISAFQLIERHNGVVIPVELAGSIWQALLTTAFGLTVGIVALIAYNAFSTRIKRVMHDLESALNEFLDILAVPPSEERGGNGSDEFVISTRPPIVEEEPFRRKE